MQSSQNIIIHQSERDQRIYKLVELPNKMKVLLISDPEATKSLGSLALPIGSLFDPKDQQGLAHYTEHMVLMGSKKYPTPSSFSEFLSQHAGSYNASTAATRTAYFFEVEHDAFNEAADRLADAIAAPKLDPENADKERNAVNAELTMARANDGFRLAQVDAETANQNHPTSQFFGGNLETLSDKPNSKLQTALEDFYHLHYSANNMVGILYSPKSIADMETLAGETYGRIPNHDRTLPTLTETALPKETLAKWINAVPAQAKKMLWVQFPIENNLNLFNEKSDEYIGYLINSRSQDTLFDKLQQEELIESVYAAPNPNRYGNSGQFTVYFSLTDKGLKAQPYILSALFSYLDLIKTQGIDPRYYAEMQKVLDLSFDYPDISRNMRYVESLSDQMLVYPSAHILDADYIANQFNANAIKKRLNEMTLANSRVWSIAPDLPTDKTAYFVQTPYSVRAIDAKESQAILTKAQQLHFSLPELNPYIADDLTIFKQTQTPQSPIFNPKGNRFHFVSQYFKEEPKAAILLSLRSNHAFETAKDKVSYAFLNYLLNRDIAQLNFQAAIAGIDLGTERNKGLTIKADGFNQHLSEMVLAVLDHYQNMPINDDLIVLARSSYLQKMDASENVQSFKRAIEVVSDLNQAHAFSNEELKAAANQLSAQNIADYRATLLSQSVPYLITLGNLTEAQNKTLFETVAKKLNFDPNTSEISYQTPAPFVLDEALKALVSQKTATTDHALYVGLMPLESNGETQSMISMLIYKMVSTWFYDELRSKEQLGYVVAALPMNINKNYGIGFIVQSNEKDIAYLNERFNAFYPLAREKIAALTEAEFDRYKQGLLSELLQAPQTLAGEMARYLNDFSSDQFDFKTREKTIEALKSITKQQVLDFYDKAITEQSGFVLYSEIIGAQEDAQFGTKSIQEPKLTVYPDASLLQKVLKPESK